MARFRRFLETGFLFPFSPSPTTISSPASLTRLSTHGVFTRLPQPTILDKTSPNLYSPILLSHVIFALHPAGAAMGAVAEFLPYYALPFVPEPERHPSFALVFSAAWLQDVRLRADNFLFATMASSPLPRLYYLYKSREQAEHTGASEGNNIYVTALEKQLVESEDREMKYLTQHRALQREYAY